jgi:hypothetical protein
MGASIRISIIAGMFLAGCSSSFQAGLTNAPVLGGDTPETRVHDVIANGHDACERSGFPQGDVLKGHMPPCGPKAIVRAATALLPEPSTPSFTPWHGLGVCASPGPGFTRSEMSLTGISFSPPRDFVCDEPW